MDNKDFDYNKYIKELTGSDSDEDEIDLNSFSTDNLDLTESDLKIDEISVYNDTEAESLKSEEDTRAEDNETTKTAEKKRDVSGKSKGAYEWIQCIVTALVFVVLMFVFVVRSIGVVGPSMQPTLQEGDNVVVSNLFYTPKAGDIVIITKESFSAEPIVKRIIATEGQTVDIDFEKGIVYVDGKALDEPYIAELTHLYEGVAFPVTVPENSVFVMGDNRNESSDSRNPDIGMIDEGCILGKVYCIVIPAGWDFSRFGSVYK